MQDATATACAAPRCSAACVSSSRTHGPFVSTPRSYDGARRVPHAPMGAPTVARTAAARRTPERHRGRPAASRRYELVCAGGAHCDYVAGLFPALVARYARTNAAAASTERENASLVVRALLPCIADVTRNERRQIGRGDGQVDDTEHDESDTDDDEDDRQNHCPRPHTQIIGGVTAVALGDVRDGRRKCKGSEPYVAAGRSCSRARRLRAKRQECSMCVRAVSGTVPRYSGRLRGGRFSWPRIATNSACMSSHESRRDVATPP